MKKYRNKNHHDFTAEQRTDGNYNLKKEGSYGYTIRVAKMIENSDDWEELIQHEAPSWAKNYIVGCDPYKTILDNYKTFYNTKLIEEFINWTPPAKEPKEKKPDQILSVRVGGKKYKLKDPHKNSKIHSFFTNNGEIWVSLDCGEQYKL